MLNLVYAGTNDEKIYRVLSQRMRDRYDLFGSLRIRLRTAGSSTSRTWKSIFHNLR